jgi:hypothetical protein
MEMQNVFLSGIKVIGFVSLVLITTGCANGKVADNCQQASLETWTDEFIGRMNQGYLPDDANQLAELVSVKTLAQCMNENQKQQ